MRKNQAPSDVFIQEDGYDGYYDDVLPEDADYVQQGIDQRLLTKILLLAAGAILVILDCILLMYLL